MAKAKPGSRQAAKTVEMARAAAALHLEESQSSKPTPRSRMAQMAAAQPPPPPQQAQQAQQSPGVLATIVKLAAAAVIGATKGAALGSIAGAALGGVLGSVAGPAGTVVGAAGGAMLGGKYGAAIGATIGGAAGATAYGGTAQGPGRPPPPPSGSPPSAGGALPAAAKTPTTATTAPPAAAAQPAAAGFQQLATQLAGLTVVMHDLAGRQGGAPASRLGGWTGGFGERQQPGGRMEAIGDTVRGGGAVAAGGIPAVGSGMSALGNAAHETADAMLSIAGGPVLGAFSELGGKMTQFVGALNPAAVEIFSWAMKDLSAVIGKALMPVFSVLTGAVKQASNLLLPVAQELAPIFGQIAQTMMSVFQPMMQLLVNQVRLVLPVFQLLADVMSLVAPVMQAYYTILAAGMKTLADLFASMFGAGYKEGMDAAKTAMQKLANYAIIAAGALLKMAANMGFKPALKGLENLLQAAKGGEQAQAGGIGAATAARVTDIRSFEREQLTAAFTATQGMGDPGKTQEKLLEESVKVLTQLVDGTLDADQAMKDLKAAIVKEIADGADKIVTAITGKPVEAFGHEVAGRAPQIAGAQAMPGGWAAAALAELLFGNRR